MTTKRIIFLALVGVGLLTAGSIWANALLATLGTVALLVSVGAVMLRVFSGATVDEPEPAPYENLATLAGAANMTVKKFDTVDTLIRDGQDVLNVIVTQVNAFSVEAFKLLEHYGILQQLAAALQEKTINLEKVFEIKGKLSIYDPTLAGLITNLHTWDMSMSQRMRETIAAEIGYVSERSRVYYAIAGEMSARLMQVRRGVDQLKDTRRQTEIDLLAGDLAATLMQGHGVLNEIQESMPFPRGSGLQWSMILRPRSHAPLPVKPIRQIAANK